MLQYPRKRPTHREVRKGTNDLLSLLSPVVWGCPEQPRQRWVPAELQRGQHHTHPWWPLPLSLARWPQLRQLSQSGQTMDFMSLWKSMFGRMQVSEKLTKKGSRNQTPPPPPIWTETTLLFCYPAIPLCHLFILWFSAPALFKMDSFQK